MSVKRKISIAAASLVVTALLAGAAHAQAGDQTNLLSYGISANAAVGVLGLGQGHRNEITGVVFGDVITGYYASGSQKYVWIRWSGRRGGATGTPTQVYVGQFRRGSGPIPDSISGVFYALDRSGGGSAQRNAWGFYARNLWPPQRSALGPNANPPPTASAALPNASGAWWATANTSTSPIVIDVDRDGEVTGWVFGEPITGHYASAAGTISFLRMRGGQPIQFHLGVATSGVGGQMELRGAFYGLNEAGGGAAQADNEFDFRAINRTNFVSYQAGRTNLCLEVENGSTTNRARLRQGVCNPSAVSQDMALLTMPSSSRTIVLRHSGRCLDIPNASTLAGEVVQQSQCNDGGANQRIIFHALNQGAAVQLIFAHSQLCLTMAGVVAGDLARQDPCTLAPNFLNLFVIAP